MDELNDARKQINEIDKQMAELFVKRMHAAQSVAEYKREHGLAILDPKREEEVVRRNSAYVEDDELRSYYVEFIRNTMSVSRAYQAKLTEGMRVSYSGVEGAFAHLAARKLFPSAVHVAYPDFGAAYRAVECGECDVAVLPTENSNNGEVGQVTDLMMSGSLYVNNMLELAIDQDLLGVKGATQDGIREVVSHPQALGQCREFITEHGYAEREYSNTALAARMVAASGDVTLGAIASAEAADIFGLEVLARKINSERSNTTKFAVFARSENTHRTQAMGVCSLLMFTVRNEAGALAKAIDIIGKHGFNMITLRSRPMKGLLWQYYFYVEAEGNLYTEQGRDMLKELHSCCDRLKALGSYEKKEQ